MTGTEYQRKAMRTAQGLTEWDLLLNGVMGLCGEAGECIDLVKKYRFQGHQLDQEKLKDELGDVMWYVAITCQALGITLQEFFTEQPTLPSENAMTESLLEQWKDLSPAQKSLVLELMRQLRRP